MKWFKFCFCLLVIFLTFNANIFSQTESYKSLNVKSFGAKGDGVTDDSFSIQQALDNASSSKTSVVFSGGTYKISKTLFTKKPFTRLVFSGGATIINSTNGLGILEIGHNNCSLENAIIIGSDISSGQIYTGFGVKLFGVQNCVIKGNSFAKISGVSILLLRKDTSGCSNNTISFNSIKEQALTLSNGFDASAILLGYSGTGYYHNNNLISNNNIDGNKRTNHGIAIIAHGRNNRVTSNNIENCLRYGILAYASKDEPNVLSGTIISGNTIRNIGAVDGTKNNMGMGIYLMKSHNSSIKNNVVENTLINSDRTETLASGAISINNSIGCVVEDNDINGSGMYGIVNLYGFNCSIVNNRVKGIRKSGVFLKNANSVIISKNVFSDIGEVTIKGNFGNTSKKAYASNGLLDLQKNVSTGMGISIKSNTFNGPKSQLVYFTGEKSDPNQNYTGNKLGNVVIENNIIKNKNFLKGNGIIIKDSQ
ncbi:glycosyl hydrolase family 28-related protein [Pedobacter steynii]